MTASDITYDGGSDADRARLLELHRGYLKANGVDTSFIRRHWKSDIAGFNLNGHTYVGAETWAKLWDYYCTQRDVVEPWTSHNIRMIIRGDMAMISCERYMEIKWTGADTVAAHANKRVRSRSTEVFARENGDWRGVHVHFSTATDGPRPGNI